MKIYELGCIRYTRTFKSILIVSGSGGMHTCELRPLTLPTHDEEVGARGLAMISTRY